MACLNLEITSLISAFKHPSNASNPVSSSSSNFNNHSRNELTISLPTINFVSFDKDDIPNI